MERSEEIDFLKCTIEDCDKPLKQCGYCASHYMRLWRYGDVSRDVKPYGCAKEFFLKAIQIDSEECNVWPYSGTLTGYGTVGYKGKRWLCHRLALILTSGPPPTEDFQAAHSCGNGNKGCFNPKHLRWATRAENMAEMVEHGRSIRGMRHPGVKLNVKKVLAIRNDKRRNYILADIYSVDRVTIHDIKTRKSWSWL